MYKEAHKKNNTTLTLHKKLEIADTIEIMGITKNLVWFRIMFIVNVNNFKGIIT